MRKSDKYLLLWYCEEIEIYRSDVKAEGNHFSVSLIFKKQVFVYVFVKEKDDITELLNLSLSCGCMLYVDTLVLALK